MKRKFYKIHQVQIIPYNIHEGMMNVLMVKSKENNKLVFPKGSIKKRETIAEAAARELFEETGATIIGHIEEPLFVYTYIKKKKKLNVIVVPAYAVETGVSYLEEGERSKIWDEGWKWGMGIKANPKAYNRTTRKLLKRFLEGDRI